MKRQGILPKQYLSKFMEIFCVYVEEFETFFWISQSSTTIANQFIDKFWFVSGLEDNGSNIYEVFSRNTSIYDGFECG